MKLIWFPESISGTCVSLQQTLPACRLAVETAIVRHGTPLFLPGWSENWSGVTGVGVVIDRLGRHIDPRFAHRYYSHIVVAVKARPDDEKYPYTFDKWDCNTSHETTSHGAINRVTTKPP